MADNSGLIKLGIFGAVAYYAYSQGWLSFLGLGGGSIPSDAYYAGTGASVPGGSGSGCPAAYAYFSPRTKQYYCSSTAPTQAQVTAGQIANTAGGGSVQAAPPAAPNPNVITGANTLDGIYTRLIAAAPSGSHGVDVWGSYLTPLLPSGGVAPDPMPIFTAAVPGFSRSQQLTGGQYWAVMAPALKTQFGLSGLGLFGGLGAVMLSHRVH